MDIAASAPTSGFLRHELGGENHILIGNVSRPLLGSPGEFEVMWALRPPEYPTIMMHGKPVRIPRWQQAYGRDYRFSGVVSTALPIPGVLTPHLEWARTQVDGRLNGLLLNWYDATLGHYIGPHRDKTSGLVPGAPIVTISLGDARMFRVSTWKPPRVVLADVVMQNGSVVVMPYDTNKACVHEITKSKAARGRRISITLRAFKS